MFHRITLIGFVGQAPQMRYTEEGTPVTNFSVATNRKWTNAEGTPGEETIWFRVTAWGKLGETCNQYLSKGRQVFVEGRLKPDPATGGPRIWTGQDGVSRASFELTALTVQFLGGRAEGAAAAPEEGAIEEGEIPF